jgi:hypothetical protein
MKYCSVGSDPVKIPAIYRPSASSHGQEKNLHPNPLEKKRSRRHDRTRAARGGGGRGCVGVCVGGCIRPGQRHGAAWLSLTVTTRLDDGDARQATAASRLSPTCFSLVPSSLPSLSSPSREHRGRFLV